MNDTIMTYDTATELYFALSVDHFDLTDSQLAGRIARLFFIGNGNGSSMQAALARHLAIHARDLLRVRLGVAS